MNNHIHRLVMCLIIVAIIYSLVYLIENHWLNTQIPTNFFRGVGITCFAYFIAERWFYPYGE